MKWRGYPTYKDSGVEWLGKVPEGWKIKRIKHICEIRYGLGEPPESDPEGIPFVRATDINRGKIDLGAVKRVNSNDIPWNRRPKLELDEILVVRSGAYTGDSAIVTPEIEGCVAGYDMVLTARSAIPRFIAWVMLSKYMLESQIYLARLRAAQPHLNAEELGGFILLLPCLGDQKSIANFLDHETNQLDTLIAKKQALIGLLKEKRTALISRTVTRGLPADVALEFGLEPHTRFKDSGIEWLGEIPCNWQTPPLYARYAVELGKMLNESSITGNNLVPYLRNADVQWDLINVTDLPKMDISESEYERYTIRQGDILVCEGGEVGRAAIVGEIQSLTGYQKALHRLRPNNSTEVARFMYYTLYWATKTGIFNAGGVSTIAHLTGEQLRKFRFPKPLFSEQTAIAAYLDRETAKLDQLIEKIQTAIERLQEYRTALITAAVTGKIDVRDWVSNKETV